jgi:hypothetical protein
MGHKLIGAVVSLLFLTSFHQAHRYRTLCFPENNMSFPENAKVATGISKADFDLVLDEFEAVMQFEVNNVENGAKLVVERLWNNNAVNAYATPYGIYRQVTFFGGLARHPEMTTDTLRVIACHELGHHLAGRPYWPDRDPANPMKYLEGTESWAAAEGEADYYSTLKCFRHLVIEGEKMNLPILTSNISDYPINEVTYAKTKCNQSFTNAKDQEICLRASMAGYSGGRIFRGYSSAAISLETPSTTVVPKTDYTHPQGQCRADTYFQGALCEISYRNSILKEDPNWHTCNVKDKYSVGLRPTCWYKPS